LELRLPDSTMLCTLVLCVVAADGTRITENFLHYFISGGYPGEREETERGLILRGVPANWAKAEWTGGMGDHDKARAEDACYGLGCGFFEWVLPLGGADLAKARRVRVLCEASSHRTDAPQTDSDVFPTTLQMFLNDVRVYQAVVRNHPHDARGVLSYLRGGVGAYGYPASAIVENALLREIAGRVTDDSLRLRCGVPVDAIVQGGLTIYGAECGRFPYCPTLVIEW
jgi:hypothetical protein